jgi:hypothetical protein
LPRQATVLINKESTAKLYIYIITPIVVISAGTTAALVGETNFKLAANNLKTPFDKESSFNKQDSTRRI